MTIFFEVSRPFQPLPGLYSSPSMVRVWWLWLAFGWLRLPFREFCETPWDWEE